jgi:hypothetical protein
VIGCVGPLLQDGVAIQVIGSKLRKLQSVTKNNAGKRGSFKIITHGMQMGAGATVKSCSLFLHRLIGI